MIDPISLALGGGQLAAGVYGAISGRKAAKKARSKQKKLIARTLAAYDNLSKRFTPSGQYGQSLRKGLETQKSRDVGAGIQHALRSGIGGTTYADVSNRYEATTGRESRLRLEDFLTNKQADIEREKAQFLGGIDVRGPSSGDISSSISSGIGGLSTMLGAFGAKTPETQTPGLASKTPLANNQTIDPNAKINSQAYAKQFNQKLLSWMLTR